MAQLRVGAFQFPLSASIADNLDAIRRGIRQAAKEHVRLLALPECALSGYAGVHLASTSQIDRNELAQAQRDIQALCQQNGMALALGTTRFHEQHAHDALVLIQPGGRPSLPYHKRAMYGDDTRHYRPGTGFSLYRVNGIRIGLRICYEFRFPEYFRELLCARADLAVMGFCMNGDDDRKFDAARAQLVARAAENGLYLLAANNSAPRQNAPSILVDPDGSVLAEAPRDTEAILVGDITTEKPAGLRAAIRRHALELNEAD